VRGAPPPLNPRSPHVRPEGPDAYALEQVESQPIRPAFPALGDLGRLEDDAYLDPSTLLAARLYIYISSIRELSNFIGGTSHRLLTTQAPFRRGGPQIRPITCLRCRPRWCWRGHIYGGMPTHHSRPVHWSPSSRNRPTEAELDLSKTKKGTTRPPSVYVAFLTAAQGHGKALAAVGISPSSDRLWACPTGAPPSLAVGDLDHHPLDLAGQPGGV